MALQAHIKACEHIHPLKGISGIKGNMKPYPGGACAWLAGAGVLWAGKGIGAACWRHITTAPGKGLSSLARLACAVDMAHMLHHTHIRGIASMRYLLESQKLLKG